MIIVEGADHVGKTTLCGYLHERTGYPFKHLGQLSPPWDYFQDYLEHAASDVILDRFVLSELAYGPVFRGAVNPRFSAHAQRCVARAINRAAGLTVYVYANWLTVAKRIAIKPDELVSQEAEHVNLHVQFTCAMSSNLALGDRGVRYYQRIIDTSDRAIMHTDVEDIRITQQAERSIRNRVDNIGVESWGSLHPNFLLVGERCAGRAWPPFSGAHGSSETLSSLLDEAEIPERAIHLVNAYGVDGNDQSAQIKELWDALGKPVIVCLGKVAKEKAGDIMMRSISFPHPQWIRRFHFYEVKKWGQALRATLMEAAC